ncbi:hypothetical protein N321_10984, partial [Antrostomus carolinensis]
LVGKVTSWSLFLGTNSFLNQNPHSASMWSVHLLFSLPKQRCINKNIKQSFLHRHPPPPNTSHIIYEGFTSHSLNPSHHRSTVWENCSRAG